MEGTDYIAFSADSEVLNYTRNRCVVMILGGSGFNVKFKALIDKITTVRLNQFDPKANYRRKILAK